MSTVPPHQSGASSSQAPGAAAGSGTGPQIPGPSSDIVMQSRSASLRAPSPRPQTPMLSRKFPLYNTLLQHGTQIVIAQQKILKMLQLSGQQMSENYKGQQEIMDKHVKVQEKMMAVMTAM